MIARFKFPALIVTLGTLSLFRGIAEGLTRGIENYSGFAPGFLLLGQGYVGALVPTQLFVFIIAALGAAWWLHRTSFGRTLYHLMGIDPDTVVKTPADRPVKLIAEDAPLIKEALA